MVTPKSRTFLKAATLFLKLPYLGYYRRFHGINEEKIPGHGSGKQVTKSIRHDSSAGMEMFAPIRLVQGRFTHARGRAVAYRMDQLVFTGIDRHMED